MVNPAGRKGLRDPPRKDPCAEAPRRTKPNAREHIRIAAVAQRHHSTSWLTRHRKAPMRCLTII